MPKTPKANKTSSRHPRAAAPVSFSIETQDIFGEDIDFVSGRHEEKDLATDMSNFLKEFRKKQAKKSNMFNSAFENQKKAIYASGRQKAQEVSRDGIQYLENLKVSLMDMRKNEKSYENCVGEVIPLWDDQDAALNNLLKSYDYPLDELFPKRAEAMADAEQTIEENPARREKSLRQFLANAHRELEEVRRQEMAATDASKMIKYYKALLTS